MGKAVLYPNFAGIPSHVQPHERWICWAEELRTDPKTGEQTWTKVPYCASDPVRHAATNNPKTWTSYAKAKSYYLGHKDRLAGVGYCRGEEEYFLDGDGFFRDLTDADERQGYAFEKYGKTFATWAWSGLQPEEIYEKLRAAGAWMEISPSGYGLHAVVRSSSIVASSDDMRVPGTKHIGLALYAKSRYLTVTGALLCEGDLSRDAADLLHELPSWGPKEEPKKAQAQSFPIRDTAAVNADMSDSAVEERLKKSRKGRILFEGGDPGGLSDNSHSGLDFALCLALAFWTRKDPGQMDRLFRASALYREDKWERDSYRESTISRAIDTQTEVWEPRPKRGMSTGAASAAHADSARTLQSSANQTKSAKKSANSAKTAEGSPAGVTGGSSGEPPPPDDPPDEAMPPPPDGSWKSLLKRGRGGIVLSCHFNADLALRWSPEWIAADIVLDEFANVIRSRGEMPWGGVVESWTDADSVRSAIWMQKNDLPVTPGIMSDVVHAWADKHRVHPLRTWLSSLVWDGKPRINSWLHDYLGAPSTNYTALAGAWWMGQCVARAFHPGCQADYTLVLEGPQGQKKSQALRVLAGDEYFTDQIADFASKDASGDLQGKWIIELGEFDRMAHKPSVVKAFLTRMEDHFRPPYGRHTLNFPRQCVFAATVNLEEYFADSTGNRRFWPVKCGEIRLDELAADREQLWAEAVVRFEHKHERRWPSTPDETSWFRGEQSQREEIDIWHGKILKWIAHPVMADGRMNLGNLRSTADIIVVADVVDQCLQIPPDKQTDGHKQRVSRTLRQLKWTPDWRGKNKGRYRVWLRPGFKPDPNEPEEEEE